MRKSVKPESCRAERCDTPPRSWAWGCGTLWSACWPWSGAAAANSAGSGGEIQQDGPQLEFIREDRPSSFLKPVEKRDEQTHQTPVWFITRNASEEKSRWLKLFSLYHWHATLILNVTDVTSYTTPQTIWSEYSRLCFPILVLSRFLLTQVLHNNNETAVSAVMNNLL